MNKLAISLIIVTVLFISCNNKTETIEITPEITIKEDIKHLIIEEDSIITTKQAEVVEKEQKISWSDFYKKFEKKPQIFSINNSKDTLLICAEGTTIKIQSNSFISEKTGDSISGTIKIFVKEYYKLSDILLANLTTTSNDLILETGGTINITAVSNSEKCKIKSGKEIEIRFPTKTKKDNMQLFLGDWKNDRINWKLTDSIDSFQVDEFIERKNSNSKFPEGAEKFSQFFSRNFRYPSSAIDQKLAGIIRIRMMIDKDGNVINPSIITGISPECDKEVLRVVSKLPKFEPAQYKGKKVDSWITFPITLSIEGVVSDRRNLKIQYQKTYSDSTINKARASEIASYLLNASDLGWINCDRFINDKREKINFFVQLNEQSQTDVKVVFHSVKSIMHAFPQNGKYVLNQVPNGEKITIIAIKSIDNQPYISVKEAIISETIENKFVFQPVSLKNLESTLKELDKLF
uniref:energy transducer TonB n=1 Tax=Flavobacterium sp. TaxID=239 RepID=UPI00404B9185